ncbi:FusB/FusC family EF-G-binding protein [Paenibacillus humicus]|uniref:FusB/FusC family EF-G-binding protein n=1 Tax=Paenibacillus humicus TaxID=412861 RepID=UPI000FDBE6DF|nr:FusB/FusC family EF-G-binding protein [Paenibacillus humicus]
MGQPFIRNHEFNLIQKQVKLLQNTCTTVSDPKVVESVRMSVHAVLDEAFQAADSDQRLLVLGLAELSSPQQFAQGVEALEPYRLSFPAVTEGQLKRLFPKAKKLKVPDLDKIDFRKVTYLGWTDIGSGKMFLVHELDGKTAGIEGRFSPAGTKKNTCFLCRGHGEVALFTAVTKHRPQHASPDYYKAIGNYMCLSSDSCNARLTDPAVLDQFFRDVLTK